MADSLLHQSDDPTLVTGDALRATFQAFNPRPGWKARNIDAHAGRCYDLLDYRDQRAIVDVNYAEGVFAQWRDHSWRVSSSTEWQAVESAMRAVEDKAAAYLTERREADPYYAGPGRFAR